MSDAADEAPDLRSSRRQMKQRLLDVSMAPNKMDGGFAEVVGQIVAAGIASVGLDQAAARTRGPTLEGLVPVDVRRSFVEVECVDWMD